jgi:hypothetical protein
VEGNSISKNVDSTIQSSKQDSVPSSVKENGKQDIIEKTEFPQQKMEDTGEKIIQRGEVENILIKIVDMSTCVIMENISLNTALLWKEISEDLLKVANTLTTKTATKLITGLRTLKYSLYPTTSKDIGNLSPNYRPILVAMKPNEGSYAENALKWKVSGLNIDGGRIGTNEKLKETKYPAGRAMCPGGGKRNTPEVKIIPNPQGRFPANLILECICDEVITEPTKIKEPEEVRGGIWQKSQGKPAGRMYKGGQQIHTNPECPCYMLDEQSGTTSKGHWAKSKITGFGEFGGGKQEYLGKGEYANDKGGASRFFMQVKVDKHCSLCFNGIIDKPLTKNICQDVNSAIESLNIKNTHKEAEKIENRDFVAKNVQESGQQNKEDNKQSKSKNANDVEKNLQNTQVTKENTVQGNVVLNLSNELVQNVRCAGNLCEQCGIGIAQKLVALKQDQDQELTLGQGFITEPKKQILLKCLVSFAEMWGNIDTIPTTENLNLLFGSVYRAIENYTEQKNEEMENEQCQTRFRYTSKASKSERNRGCEELEEKAITEAKGNGLGRVCNICGTSQLKPCDCRNNSWILPVKNKNNHPTVKSIALMEYLCTLTKTPTGGIVLDPFAGSGTTCIAAKKTDRNFIGIELSEEYCKIADARISAYKNQTKLF